MELSEHTVRERAYFIWEQGGREFGRSQEHWLQAEAELRAGDVAEIVAEAQVAPVQTAKPRASRAKAAAKPASTVAKPAGKKRAGSRSATESAAALH